MNTYYKADILYNQTFTQTAELGFYYKEKKPVQLHLTS